MHEEFELLCRIGFTVGSSHERRSDASYEGVPRKTTRNIIPCRGGRWLTV